MTLRLGDDGEVVGRGVQRVVEFELGSLKRLLADGNETDSFTDDEIPREKLTGLREDEVTQNDGRLTGDIHDLGTIIFKFV